jgi:hypothetical protein
MKLTDKLERIAEDRGVKILQIRPLRRNFTEVLYTSDPASGFKICQLEGTRETQARYFDYVLSGR